MIFVVFDLQKLTFGIYLLSGEIWWFFTEGYKRYFCAGKIHLHARRKFAFAPPTKPPYPTTKQDTITAKAPLRYTAA